MADRILALDVGTQSARAIAVDPDGRIAGAARVPFEPYRSPAPGFAEQDPAVWWRALADACRTLWASGLPPGSIAGVALTTQRATIVPVDAEGEPVRPAIVWLDTRRTEGIPRLGGPTGLAFRLARVSETVERFRAESEWHWLARHEPDALARTRHYLLLSGYLTHRLTGRFVDSSGAQVGYLPFDFRRLAWAAPGNWRWKALPLDPSLLPELVPPGATLGTITAAAAEATGIPAGLPLVATAADRACEALGAGALDPDVACVGYGTTATVSTIHRRYLEVVPLVPAYPAAIPDAWSVEFQIYRGFWLVEWFRRELGHPERELAAAGGDATSGAEALLDRLLDLAPPGADGLLHLPYWSPGLRFPGPEARGAFVGLTDLHSRAHLYRATIEGLAYGLRDGLERSERASGTRTRRLVIAGGGSRGTGIAQLTADVFGLPVGVPTTSETASLGAAIVGSVGLGIHPDHASAVAAMARARETRDPAPDRHARYDALYRGVFLGLYDALRPSYRAIRRITGYPP